MFANRVKQKHNQRLNMGSRISPMYDDYDQNVEDNILGFIPRYVEFNCSNASASEEKETQKPVRFI